MIQLEDCIDVVKKSYGNKFIIKSIVDHSCVHDQQRKDGRNVNVTNVGHEGRQRIIHDSKLTKEIR